MAVAKTDLILEHTRLFADEFCKAIEGMSGQCIFDGNPEIREEHFHPKYRCTVMIHFTGSIQGEYAVSMEASTARSLAAQPGRSDFQGFLKEALNVSVGSSIPKLRQHFSDLTFLPPVAILGEVDYPKVPSGSLFLQAAQGNIQCAFVLNAMELELGEHLQHALKQLQESSKESAIIRRNMQNLLAAFPFGLAVLDEIGLIMPGHSPATSLVVGLKQNAVLSGMHILECIGFIDPRGLRRQEFDLWMKTCFSQYGRIDFPDLTCLCPIVESRTLRDRVIHLQWIPMEDEQGRLESLAVLIEDYTEKRRLEAKALTLGQQHEENAELLSQIITLEPEDITDFIYDSNWLLEESKRILQQSELARTNLDVIYRNIHTLKGNSGQFKFRSLQSLVADIEKDIAQVRETNEPDSKRISKILKGIEDADEYLHKLEDLRIKLAARSETLENKISRAQPSITVPLQGVRQASQMLRQLLEVGRKICEHQELIDQLENASADVSRLILVDVRQYDELLHAAIERIANRLNKSVHFEIMGQSLLDIEVFRKIQQALVHLINNSVDHGIESVRQRLNLGKPASGLVRVRWLPEPSLMRIEFSDDGAGIDPKLIREKIELSGLTPPDTEQELYQWIFKSGFTTKSIVSDTSGRGIGMDVVRSNLEELGGSVHVHSILGLGTTFLLEFPQAPVPFRGAGP